MRIVICAAGLGSRLGLDVPKCLVPVGGKPIIHRQLEILTQLASDIVVVAGFKFGQVVDSIGSFGVKVVCNENYRTTSVVDSVRIGMTGASEIVAVDGDVLFTAEDMNKLLNTSGDVVCIKDNISNDNPVYVTTDAHIQAFHRDKRSLTDREWAGICKVPTAYFEVTDKYVYHVLERHLPIPYLVIDSVEIDNTEDLAEANQWIRR